MVESEDFTSDDRLILGKTFLAAFNLTIHYDTQKIGLQGFSQPAPATPLYKTFNFTLFFSIVLVILIIFGVGVCLIVKKRRERLAQKLAEEADRLI
jgi:heme/copper-type cytochrome/quinol oxidase subunit 2